MSAWHVPIALIFACAVISPTLAAAEPDSHCNEQRQSLRAQLQQARLQGDKPRQNQLNTELQNLTEQCQGLVALHPRQIGHGHAALQVERRETLLREALGSGDAQLIELRRNQLAEARAKLESLRQ
ncbi:DUF1090 domain-containing protein [Pseudomonas lopnurensis]|uniref:DUF1090 domain-containing protein n=1 Tax=Pseudomonas lopnurensis TaxID=1477517 RepID=UPI0028AB48E3|nr:DUF1090 domain-containing protein [Pseudomonas lopnurensis]